MNTKKCEKCKIYSGTFALIFHKYEIAFNSGIFLWRCDVWHGTMTILLLTTCKTKTVAGSQHDDFPDLWRDDLSFSGDHFFKRRFEKKVSQSLSYSIFAKTLGHFCTVSSTYAKGEKL